MTLPAAPPAPTRRFRFGALGYRNFRLFFSGFVVSLIGLWMHRVAQAWLVLEITNSAFWVGFVDALGSIPVLLLSLWAGVIADRVSKRPLIMVTQSAAMLLALALAAVTLIDRAVLWQVAAVAAGLGVVNAFDIPARQSFLVEMVGKDDLMSAVALNSSAFNASRAIGPAVGGLVVAALGVGVCFLANGVTYGAVLVALVMMRLPRVRRTAPPSRTMAAIGEGLRYALGDARIRVVLLNIVGMSIFGLPTLTLMPVLVRDVLHGDARAYGWAMSAIGLGALIGALVLAGFARRVRKGRVLGGTAAAFGVMVALVGLSRSLPLTLALLTLAGMAMIVTSALTNTTLQILAPDELRGRVVSLYSLSFIGMMPIGSLAGGAVAAAVGAPAVIAVGGAVVTLIALLGVVRSPAVRGVE